jgi:hypothetical protein
MGNEIDEGHSVGFVMRSERERERNKGRGV